MVTKTAKDVYFATYGTGSRCKTMNSDDDEVFSKVGGRSSYVRYHTCNSFLIIRYTLTQLYIYI